MKTWNKVTPAKLNNFLMYLGEHAIVTEACKQAGISEDSARRYRASDMAFSLAWDQAQNDAAGVVEKELYRRAIVGESVPVGFYKGSQGVMTDGSAAVKMEKSDRLLLALVKRFKPELYGDKQEIHVSGSVTHESKIAGTLNLNLSDIRVLSARHREMLGEVLEQVETNRENNVTSTQEFVYMELAHSDEDDG